MKNLFTIIIITLGIFSQSQTLEELIQVSLNNNPSIHKMNFQYELAKEKVNEVNTLPNTEFNFGFMALKPEMEMPMTRFSVSAMQMIPWFGTIKTKEKYVSSLAETKAVDIKIAQKKLALSVAEIYYQLYEIKAQQKILKDNIRLLKIFEELALSSVKVGKASSVDVLRLKIQRNEMEEEINVLHAKTKGLEIAMNSLLNRAYDAPIEIIKSLNFPKNSPIYAFENLNNHPIIQKLEKVSLSIDQSELVNRLDSKPMIGFGIEYINQTNSQMITSDFKDMVMPMVSLSIPIFNNKYKSISLQNNIRQQEIESDKNNQLNILKAQLAKAISALEEAKIKYNTQIDNLEITKNAEEILLKNYETGTIDYDEVLKIQALELKFQKNKISAIKQYYNQLAIIDYLTNN